MDLFGFEIKRKEPQKNEKSFVAPSTDDAIESIRAGGYYGTYLDLEGVAHTEAELVKRYRDIAMMADVDTAVEDIINESIAQLENESPVELNLDDVQLSSAVRKSIQKEFEEIINIKVRSTGRFLKAKINILETSADVKILDKETGISPGQACVFYSKDDIGDKVLGGGWIDKIYNKNLSTKLTT